MSTPDAIYGSYVYGYRNDTVVHGITYKQFNYYDDLIVREDTLLQKVFAIDLHDTDTSERLVYDFTLAINDTFRCRIGAHYVSSVDSVQVGSVWHRVWKMASVLCDTCLAPSPLYDYDVIEGIGSITEPLGPLNPTYFEAGYFLACFYQCEPVKPLSKRIGWTFDNSSSCVNTYGVGIDELTRREEVTEFWPNPAEQSLNISSWRPIETVTIFDMMGREIIQLVCDHPTTNTTVEVAQLPAGLYFAKINGTSAWRFVKR